MSQCSAAPLAALLAAAALGALACGPRPATVAGSAPPGLEPDLDFFLLAAAPSTTLRVEIDRVEGLDGPSPTALEALREALSGATGKRIVVELGGTVLRTDWEAGPREPEALAGRVAGWLDLDPTRREDFEALYVLYAPRAAGAGAELHGWFARAPARGKDGRRVLVPALFVFEDAVRGEAALWIGPEKIERRALIHEVGHALGLVANPDHAVEGDPAHCTVSGCVLQPPRRGPRLREALAALGGRVPWRFCARCADDLRTARARFAAEAADGKRLRERIRRREARELFGAGSVPGARAISPDGE